MTALSPVRSFDPPICWYHADFLVSQNSILPAIIFRMEENRETRAYRTLAEIALLPSLFFMVLGWPFAQGNELSEQLFEGFFLAVILLAAAVSSVKRLRVFPVFAFGTAALVFDTISHDQNQFLERVAIWCDLFFSVSLSVVLLLRIFDVKRAVTWRVVLNALSVYLLIGLAFGAVYNLLGLGGEPFNIGYEFAQNDPDLRGFAANYFSFVTLTTLGFGDITPGNAKIASVAVAQVLIGQFYLAVIVARLVGLFSKKAAN